MFLSTSEEETKEFGYSFSSLLKKGSIVTLNGPLGSGKTCLVKGIALGLGIEDEILSPSFTIISEYETLLKGERIPFYHIDFYRLNGYEDFLSVGGEDIIYGGGISIIEWGDQIEKVSRQASFIVDIAIIGDNSRQINIRTLK